MNCAEVMEWMHRYLDHDLSQDEIIEMFRHIDNCPSCADVFDRLSMLSQQLEQMPDVKPPFSLVDSILPKLDELDRGLHQQSDARTAEQPDEQVIVPFSRKSSRSKPAKGTSMATRTGIGAVAAAVLLGIAIFNMPEKMPDAQVEQSLSNSADHAANSDSTRKMASESAPDSAGSGADMNDQADKSGMDAFSAMESGQTDGGSAPASEDRVASIQPDAASAEPSASAPDMGKATQKPDKNTAPPEKNLKASPPASDSSADRDPSITKRDGQDSAGNGGGNAAGQDSSLQDSVLPPSSDTEAGIMSLLPPASALAANQQSWTSPDGRHMAELAGQQLVIYSIPAGGTEAEKQAVTSLPLDGKWVSGEWSGDGAQFTYVTEQEGANVTRTFTLAPAESPAASPSAAPTATPAGTPAGASSTN